jgi:type II secretory ATPase GspE/PulE/Tfp pilus assembly ATPase PilB-like protein
LAEIKKGLKGLPKNIDVPEGSETIKIAKENPKGCAACNFTGFKGRKGLYEIFLLEPSMEKFVLGNPPVSEIKALLAKKGMVTIYQSGLIEVLMGETTLAEVKRVVEADE